VDTIGFRLKILRAQNHKTQDEIAAALNALKVKADRGTVARWENDTQEPTLPKVQALAKIYGVSTDYIIDGKDMVITPIRINVLGHVPAGVPFEAIEDIVGWEDLDPRVFNPSHEYFGLVIRGDSMYPKYMEGDTIICQRDDDAESGRDVVAYIDGYDALVKQLIKYENGNIELRPLNTVYPPRVFTPEQAEMEPVRILGFVREIRRKV